VLQIEPEPFLGKVHDLEAVEKGALVAVFGADRTLVAVMHSPR